MNNIGKYFIGLLILLLIGSFCWYFSSIIAYVLISAVISFIGRPIVDLLGKVKIKGHKLSDAICAAVAIIAIWALFILFFSTIIPLVSTEFQKLGTLSVNGVVTQLNGPIEDAGKMLKHFGLLEPQQDVKKYITDNLSSLVDITKIQSIFGSLAGTISGIFVALFSITFISFFFLKDSRLFTGMVLAILPAQHEESGRKAIDSIQHLLVRYFVGILIEVFLIMALNTIGLSIVGIAIGHAIAIGLITGILNVVPYIGPIIGVIFGLSVGIAINIDMPFYTDLMPLLIYMAIAMLFTQLIDNIVIQPLIYGNSVYAHPLEIFLVILMAGSIAGIPGMILAIPGYTVLRVILREFFNKYKLVKTLTKNMNN